MLTKPLVPHDNCVAALVGAFSVITNLRMELFHAFMLSLKRSNQFPHHILILQGRVPRCPGLVSRDTALDSRGEYIPVDTVLQGKMFVVSINLQSPVADLLVPRQNVATNWQ